MVQLQRKEEGEKKGTSHTGKVDGRRGKEGEKVQKVQRLWGMLYADDAGIVSRSGGLERMMTVIVTAWSSFGLTVSEAIAEMMCLETKGGGKVSFTINAAGQVYTIQTNNRVCVLGRGYQETETKTLALK